MTTRELELADQFWDCECEDLYIHPVTKRRCLACGARRDDQPNSRVNEVSERFQIPEWQIRRAA